MASRHNKYARLLGTVENNPQPLVKRVSEQGMTPASLLGMTDVPDVGDIGAECQQMGDRLITHGKKLKAMSALQPSFNEIADIDNSGLPMESY